MIGDLVSKETVLRRWESKTLKQITSHRVNKVN